MTSTPRNGIDSGERAHGLSPKFLRSKANEPIHDRRQLKRNATTDEHNGNKILKHLICLCQRQGARVMARLHVIHGGRSKSRDLSKPRPPSITSIETVNMKQKTGAFSRVRRLIFNSLDEGESKLSPNQGRFRVNSGHAYTPVVFEEGAGLDRPNGDGVDEKIFIAGTGPPITRSRALKQSRSVPGFVRYISYKLSTSFGNPTVVHRPNFRRRLGLTFTEDLCKDDTDGLFDASRVCYTDTVSSNDRHSSFDNSNASKRGCIHSLTEYQGDFGNNREDPMDQTSSRRKKLMIHHDLFAERISTHPKRPTIKTVESTANAKVFFETHFDGILSGCLSPRSMRRRRLERKLAESDLGIEQQHQEKKMWLQRESDYLRQLRALKSNRLSRTGSSIVNAAGYEVIKILGKGSFGVVRLVKERADYANSPSRSYPLPVVRESCQASEVNMSFSQPRSCDVHSQKQCSCSEKVYAMKVIRKSEMLRNSQEGHLRAERDFLVASEGSRWVVRLIESFQDRTNLYLVMEYLIGGDFLGLLIDKDRLDEGRTQFYIAEMILCIEEAHKLRWIHRDVKPDNFLISSTGHLKISDFGLAFDGHWSHDQSYYYYQRYSLLQKLGIDVRGDNIDQNEAMTRNRETGADFPEIDKASKHRHFGLLQDHGHNEREHVLEWRNRIGRRVFAKSAVGTSQYMAPEVIRGEEYDGRCDWWSIGIIMYECLYGETPFIGYDRQTTKQNIMRHQETLFFPPDRKFFGKFNVSRTAKDLIQQILREKEDRLCSDVYALNDCTQYQDPRDSLLGASSNSNDCFVFPNDATQIKAHPFFNGVGWESLHLVDPPHIPKVNSCLDTTYFDQQGTISDPLEVSPSSDANGKVLFGQPKPEQSILGKIAPNSASTHQVGDDSGHCSSLPTTHQTDGKIYPQGAKPAQIKIGEIKLREKRARDRILRDDSLAKDALELRKQGAFLGYSYRRPGRMIIGTDD